MFKQIIIFVFVLNSYLNATDIIQVATIEKKENVKYIYSNLLKLSIPKETIYLKKISSKYSIVLVDNLNYLHDIRTIYSDAIQVPETVLETKIITKIIETEIKKENEQNIILNTLETKNEMIENVIKESNIKDINSTNDINNSNLISTTDLNNKTTELKLKPITNNESNVTISENGIEKECNGETENLKNKHIKKYTTEELYQLILQLEKEKNIDKKCKDLLKMKYGIFIWFHEDTFNTYSFLFQQYCE
jgi:hypothetical protein